MSSGVRTLGAAPGGQVTFQQARVLAFAGASASFLGLAFIVALIHVLRLVVRRRRPADPLAGLPAPGPRIAHQDSQAA